LIQDPNIFSSWVLYYSKFLTAYHGQGIDFWGMTVQNEPEFAAPWEACVYHPEQERDFLKNYLGPVIARDHPDVNIMIYDHNKDHVVTWAQTILSDPDAAKYVWGTAFHWYSGDAFDNVNQVHQLFPDKSLLASEACNCPMEMNNWAYGEAYGHDILGDLNNFANGWTDWNIVLDAQGGPNHLNNNCAAPIIADVDAQTINFQPAYYYMGHFSRYLLPGSVRLNVTVTGSNNIQATSFFYKDTTIVIVLNESDNTFSFKLAVADSPFGANVTLLAHSIVTLSFLRLCDGTECQL